MQGRTASVQTYSIAHKTRMWSAPPPSQLWYPPHPITTLTCDRLTTTLIMDWPHPSKMRILKTLVLIKGKGAGYEKPPQGTLVQRAYPTGLHQHHPGCPEMHWRQRNPRWPCARQYHAYLVTQASNINSVPFVLLGKYQKKQLKVIRINSPLWSKFLENCPS